MKKRTHEPIKRLLLMGALAVAALQRSFHAPAQTIGTIKTIDLSTDKPDQPSFKTLQMKMKGTKYIGLIILRQFSRRARIEFEGEGLRKGTYVLATAKTCPKSLSSPRYKSQLLAELHTFKWNYPHMQTEKSLPGYSLYGDDHDKSVLEGKAIVLFRLDGATPSLIGCEPVG